MSTLTVGPAAAMADRAPDRIWDGPIAAGKGRRRHRWGQDVDADGAEIYEGTAGPARSEGDRPAIDLTNRQEVATHGLTSFNAAAMLATFCLVGSFVDHELWQAARAQTGSEIHRVSLGPGSAALLEICVLLTAAIAGRKRASPITVDVLKAFRSWEAKAQTGCDALRKMLACVATCT